MPTEKTPKGAAEVPVHKRADFFANLKKVAKVRKDSGSGSRSTSSAWNMARPLSWSGVGCSATYTRSSSPAATSRTRNGRRP